MQEPTSGRSAIDRGANTLTTTTVEERPPEGPARGLFSVPSTVALGLGILLIVIAAWLMVKVIQGARKK